MIYQGDNYHRCLECKRILNFGDIITQGKRGYYCQQCSERKNMPNINIKITAEVDGKIVPLETISTETFEAIKALEKPKAIPVARLASFYISDSRLIFKPMQNIQLEIGRVYVFDVKNGSICANWPIDEDWQWIRKYKNVIPL